MSQSQCRSTHSVCVCVWGWVFVGWCLCTHLRKINWSVYIYIYQYCLRAQCDIIASWISLLTARYWLVLSCWRLDFFDAGCNWAQQSLQKNTRDPQPARFSLNWCLFPVSSLLFWASPNSCDTTLPLSCSKHERKPECLLLYRCAKIKNKRQNHTTQINERVWW